MSFITPTYSEASAYKPASREPVYSIGARFLRAAVFQNGVNHPQLRLESFLIQLVESFRQQTCHPKTLDPQRAERGLSFWRKLGAKEFIVTPRDKQASIHGVSWHAKDLEAEIQKHGGTWKRLEIQNPDDGREQAILAIIPPEQPTAEWNALEKCFQKLRWQKQIVHSHEVGKLEVFITCYEPEETTTPTKVVLYSNSGSVSFIMEGARVGYHLGAQRDVYFYDPRGTWKSTGTPSEAGYYNDILAVYERVRKHYAEEQIWVNGACLGVNAAAFVKISTKSACNLILENGFSDLYRDFIRRESLIPRLWAKTFKNGLFARDINSADKPRETSFSIEAMCKELDAPLQGKIIVIGPSNDQRLPQPATHMRNVDVVKRISTSIYSLLFCSAKSDPHFDRYYLYSDARRALVRAFKASPGILLHEPYEYPKKQYTKTLFAIALITTLAFVLWRRS